MPRKRRSRVYLRAGRYWGDFRDFAAQGGKREPLISDGDTYATPDEAIAGELAAARVRDLQERKRNKVLLGVERQATLAAYAAYHLERKAESSEVTDRWLEETEVRLQRAVEYFGADRELGSISVRDVQNWLSHLAREKHRGRSFSRATIRHYLQSLSNLYRRAVAEGYAVLNPAAAIMDKPQPQRRDSLRLEVADAALYLEAARTWKPDLDAGANPAIFEIVATFLLTGGRSAEVLGLDLEDVSFDRKTITFRNNNWRRLKNRTSARTVPLWPQLEEILREYVFGGRGPKSGLLYPSHRGEAAGRMITDVRKSLNSIGERAGWQAGEIRTRRFRTTYTAGPGSRRWTAGLLWPSGRSLGS
jgi:integrase